MPARSADEGYTGGVDPLMSASTMPPPSLYRQPVPMSFHDFVSSVAVAVDRHWLPTEGARMLMKKFYETALPGLTLPERPTRRGEE